MERIEFNLTRSKPEGSGYYLYRAFGNEEVYLYRVAKGDWQLCQNPEWLYADKDSPIETVNPGLWCGPIVLPMTKYD